MYTLGVPVGLYVRVWAMEAERVGLEDMEPLAEMVMLDGKGEMEALGEAVELCVALVVALTLLKGEIEALGEAVELCVALAVALSETLLKREIEALGEAVELCVE